MKTVRNLETVRKKKAGNFTAKFFKQELSAWVILLPAIICIYYVVIRPQVFGTAWSFYDMKGYNLGEFVGLENYRRVISDSMFMKSLINTFIYVGLSIVIGYMLPIIIAIMLNEMVHMRSSMRLMIYLPALMPATTTALLWYLMYYPDNGGLLNMVLSMFGKEPYGWLQDSGKTILYIVISMTWNGMGATVIYYFASLQGVSRDLFEAAIIDGAGFWKRCTTITVPHIIPIALLLLVRQIIGVFSIIDQPLQMTGGGPNGASSTLGLMAYNYGFVSVKPQFAMVVGVIMFLILIVFTLFYFFLDKKLSADI